MEIANTGIRSVSPYKMIHRRVKLADNNLTIQEDGAEKYALDLKSFHNVFIIGAGKATAPMARALEEILGSRIKEGAIAVKPGHTADLSIITQIEGGHPIPSKGSIAAAREIAAICRKAGDTDLVINLLSGGGSALLSLPHHGLPDQNIAAVTLEEMQEVTKALISCGASIQEINCIRKHISAIKGGRLAELIYPARSINLILSDVVGDDLQSIASGLTVADRSTYGEALQIIEKYGIKEEIPEKVIRLLSAGAAGNAAETPKSDAECFSRMRNILLGTNSAALHAAAAEAEKLGYRAIILSSKVTGEAREIAKFYAAVAREAAGTAPVRIQSKDRIAASNGESDSRKSGTAIYEKPLCILSGGETTVTIRGSGRGGRNQEMALAFLAEVAARPDEFSGVLFASIATDGNDGPTDAAGAFASADLSQSAEKNRMNIADYLADNNAYNFFDKIDGLIKTGPTNTNVCDMQIIMIS